MVYKTFFASPELIKRFILTIPSTINEKSMKFSACFFMKPDINQLVRRLDDENVRGE